jgi:glycine/D-amino acid oxidase-like deaminating enzyme
MSEFDRPLFPVKDRLESFWLDQRDRELSNARTTPHLPKSADVVIIGSGMAGAMTAYQIYEEAKRKGIAPPRVVMVEADETCGSATARNGELIPRAGLTPGGHCKPVTFLGYNTLKAKHGKDVANALLELEEGAMKIYGDVVEKEKIECDLHFTRSCDMFFDAADAERAKGDFEGRKADWPEIFAASDVQRVDSPEEIVKITGVKGALWSASYPAGHLWPYLLATSRK